MKIEIKGDGNIHVDGVWLTDEDGDTTWMRQEAARFLAVADFLDERRARINCEVCSGIDTDCANCEAFKMPAWAVEAAHDQHCHDPYHLGPICDEYRTMARAALEAAAPHMLAQAWDEGYLACVDDVFRDKELGKHGQRLEDGQRNPYMQSMERPEEAIPAEAVL